MKNIFLFLLLLSATTVYGQRPPADRPVPLSGRSGAPYAPPGILSAYVFDSVRLLTELQSPIGDISPCISGDGLRLFFRSVNLSTGVSAQMYYSERPDTGSFFGAPVPVNGFAFHLGTFWVSEDEQDIYLRGNPITHATRLSALTYSAPVPLTMVHPFSGNASFGRPSLDSARNTLFCTVDDVPSYQALCEFSRTAPGTFTLVRQTVVPPVYFLPDGQLSKDGLTYFLDATNVQANQRKIYQLTRPTLTDSFAISTLQEVIGLNAPFMSNVNASLSDDLRWAAFARSSGSLEDYDLYLARRDGTVTSVLNPALQPATLSIYPNPSTGTFRLSSTHPGKAEVAVYSLTGERVFHAPALELSASPVLDLSAQPKGLYLLQLRDGKRIETRKLVIE